MEKVADHLGLDGEARKRMTFEQYNDAAGGLSLHWSARRVQPAFGSWDNAKMALLAIRLPRNRHDRMRRTKAAKRDHRCEEALRGVKIWLAGDPDRTSAEAYESLRTAFNDAAGPGQRLLVTAQTVKARLRAKSWADLLGAAEGRATVAEPPAQPTGLWDEELVPAG